MNRKVFIICIGIFLIIMTAAGYLLLSSDAKEAKDTMTSKPTGTESVSPSVQTAQNSGQGRYIEYEEGIVTNTSGDKLLFFHAPWCPQCRDIEEDIKEQGVPGGLTIIKVDYDTNQALRQKYGITLQTTFVEVDDNGELIDKFVAYNDPTLDAVLKRLQ